MADSHVIRMTLTERGAYITLLCLCWLEQSLPVDLGELAKMCRVSQAAFAKLWPALEPCFTIADGRLVQPRIERERRKQEHYRALKSEAGKTGGRPLKAKADRNQKEAQVIFEESKTKANESSPSSSSSSIVVPTELLNARERPALDVVPDEDPQLRRAGKLLERYAELFHEHRRGARYHNRMHLDFPKACELVRTWADDARLEKLAVIVLTTDDDWISKTDRGFGVFAARATWADDRLSEWEAEHGLAAPR